MLSFELEPGTPFADACEYLYYICHTETGTRHYVCTIPEGQRCIIGGFCPIYNHTFKNPKI